MPYEQLDKLVNEDLLNQYIESRYRSWPCSFAPSMSGTFIFLPLPYACDTIVALLLQHSGECLYIHYKVERLLYSASLHCKTTEV